MAFLLKFTSNRIILQYHKLLLRFFFEGFMMRESLFSPSFKSRVSAELTNFQKQTSNSNLLWKPLWSVPLLLVFWFAALDLFHYFSSGSFCRLLGWDDFSFPDHAFCQCVQKQCILVSYSLKLPWHFCWETDWTGKRLTSNSQENNIFDRLYLSSNFYFEALGF